MILCVVPYIDPGIPPLINCLQSCISPFNINALVLSGISLLEGIYYTFRADLVDRLKEKKKKKRWTLLKNTEFKCLMR